MDQSTRRSNGDNVIELFVVGLYHEGGEVHYIFMKAQKWFNDGYGSDKIQWRTYPPNFFF